MSTRIRVDEFNGPHSLIVVGTNDIQKAAKLLPDDVTRWGGSFTGYYTKRNRKWNRTHDGDVYPLPKDAVLGVVFAGVQRMVI